MYPIFTSDFMGISAATANWVANGIIALVVLFLLYLAYKVFTRPRMASGRRSRNARLAITDAASIDDRRRLVLVRRDDVEHLIMIGGATDMVIESDISRSGAAKTAPAATTAAQDAGAPAPARQTPPPLSSVPAGPAAANSGGVKPANIPPIPVKPAASARPVQPSSAASTSQSDANSLIGDVRPKPAASQAPSAASSPTPSATPAASTASAPSASSNGSGSTLSSSTSSSSASASSTSASSGSTSSAAPAVEAAKPKTSVGDNMDALLTEITAKK